jgi:BON domain
VLTHTIVLSIPALACGDIARAFKISLEIAIMNSIRLKTLGFAILVGQLISGCVLEKPATPEDARITSAVRGLLDEHPDLGPSNSIYVSTSKRVVYLSGQVSTGNERADAETIARRAPGVVEIVNNVAVEN